MSLASSLNSASCQPVAHQIASLGHRTALGASASDHGSQAARQRLKGRGSRKEQPRLTGSAPAGAKRPFRQRARYSELCGSGNEAEGGSLRHWSSHLCINLHGLSGQMSACLKRFQWLAPFRDGLAGRLHTSFLASSRPPSQCDGVGIEESLSTQSSARVRILVTKRKKVFEGYGASRMS